MISNVRKLPGARAGRAPGVLVLVLALALGFAGCGGGGDGGIVHPIVTNPTNAISALEVAPANPSVSVGSTVQLVPAVTTAGGAVTVSYSYVSSSPAVASVDSRGVVTGIAPGTAVVTVTASGSGTGFAANSIPKTSTITVLAANAACTAATLTPSTNTLLVGATATLTPATTKANTAVVVTNQFVSGTPAVATVGATGIVTGVSPGTTTITYTATCTGSGLTQSVVTAQTSITVNSVTVPAIANWSLTRIHGPVYSASLFSGWAADAQTIYVGGNDGVDVAVGGVWRSTNGGTAWSRALETTSSVVGVSGTSASNVWALTYRGHVYRSTGGAFTMVRDEDATQRWADIVAIGNSVFIVGDGGRIMRSLNGGAFVNMTSGTTANLAAIAASSESNVFAVTNDSVGGVQKFDGTSWSRVYNPTNPTRLYDVWVGGPNAVVAVGSDGSGTGGREVRYTGTTWSLSAVPSSTLLSAINGTSLTDLTAADTYNSAKLLRNTGSGWTATSATANWFDIRYLVTSPIAGTAIALGASGSIQSYNGSSFSVLSSDPNLSDVHLVTPTVAFAVGGSNGIYRWNGSAMTVWALNGSGSNASVWGLDANDVLIGTASKTLDRYTNATLASQWNSPSIIRDIWGASATTAYVVGDAGYIGRWNGSSLLPMTSGTTVALTSIFGFSENEIYAAGASGILLRFNGSTWNQALSPTSSALTSVWGTSGSDLYVSDSNFVVRRFNGTAWSVIPTQLTGSTIVGFSNSPTDVYMLATGVGRYQPGVGFTLLPVTGAGSFARVTQVSGIPGSGVAVAVGTGAALWVGRSSSALFAADASSRVTDRGLQPSGSKAAQFTGNIGSAGPRRVSSDPRLRR